MRSARRRKDPTLSRSFRETLTRTHRDNASLPFNAFFMHALESEQQFPAAICLENGSRSVGLAGSTRYGTG
ncbi:hypothetical protein CesoFtcFv8_021617 [Champsocephalus esox]|uniref:Uncharacterized protein n=1 Tax=Champsocephalus esox TaxID=159716 RepID=A0AAN8B8U7_9TELE|nr:hypothetical protein CesoFtcFv8_021617 [Champsocephalus esox]